MNSKISTATPAMFEPLRNKRRLAPSSPSEMATAQNTSTPFEASGPAKRTRSQRKLQLSIDAIADKENFHRSRPLAPRSRPAKVLFDLVLDVPTDCTDYEVSDYDGDESPSSFGEVYLGQMSRMNDGQNSFYNFTVFEDPPHPVN